MADAEGPHVCVLVARLRTYQDVGMMGRREGRTEEYAHCDPDRKVLNGFGTDIPGLDPTNWVACLKADIERKGARVRAGASVAAHLVLIASPE